MKGLTAKEKRELAEGKVPDVYENSSDLYDALLRKDKEVVVTEIGECQLEDINTAEEAIKDLRCLCYNYEGKWSDTTFKYFMKCCDLIEQKLKGISDLKENLTLKSYARYDEFANRDYMVYEVKHKRDISPVYVSRDLFILLKELTNEPRN